MFKVGANKTAVAIKKFHVKKGDRALVLAGKDKDKIGKVLEINRDSGKALVEGVNKVKRHQRPTQKMAKGGIIEREPPIPVSKLMVVCPKCGKGTRIKRHEVGDKHVRVCGHSDCGEQLDA